MTSQEASDLNDLSGAIGWLKHFHRLVENELRGTADARFEDCKNAKRAIASAEAAYRRMAERIR